jgi:hypothetical protein
VREPPLEADFSASVRATLSGVGQALQVDLGGVQPVVFTPLKIRGLECLAHRTECLGDCPDAAYFGPHVYGHSGSNPRRYIDVTWTAM